MKLKIFMLMVFVMCVSTALSAQTFMNCYGTVTKIMDYPGYCNSNTMFQTTNSNGKWICTTSNKADAIVLAALAAGKSVNVYLDDEGGTLTCSNLVNDKTPHRIMVEQ